MFDAITEFTFTTWGETIFVAWLVLVVSLLGCVLVALWLIYRNPHS